MPGRRDAADELALERMLGAEYGAQAAPLRRRFGQRLGLAQPSPADDHAAAENVGVEIDRDDEARAEHARGRHRHRIDQRAVNEPAAVERNRRENSGQRVGGPHRIDQPAARQPDFVAGADLGRDGGEADRQRLDRRVAEFLFQPRRELAAADQAAAGKRDVEIAEDAALGQAARPFLDDVEPAGGVAAADHGADRGADDDVGLDAVREQRAEHADMGKAARAAAAERKPDGRAHGCALRRFGCRFGAAIAVSSAARTLENQMCSPSAAMITPRRRRYKAVALLW